MLLPGCCFLNGAEKSREIMANNKISALYHTLFQSRGGQRDEAWIRSVMETVQEQNDGAYEMVCLGYDKY